MLRVVTVSLRGTSVIPMSINFQFGFERRTCPSLSASAKTSVRRERPVKEEEKEEFEEEGSKEDGDKAPAAKRRKVPKSSIKMFYTYTRITCRLR